MAAFRKVIVKTETCVSCPTCSWEIPMLDTQGLRREFSVRCPNCGGRKVYQLAQIHDQTQEVATPISRRIEFGTRCAIDDDQTAGKPMLPKSRLAGLAAWLLQ